MRILFCGDLVGRSGRDVVVEHLPHLRKDLKLDFVIVNGENAAHGFGITEKICEEVLSLPMFPEISEKQQAYVSSIIRNLFGESVTSNEKILA